MCVRIHIRKVVLNILFLISIQNDIIKMVLIGLCCCCCCCYCCDKRRILRITPHKLYIYIYATIKWGRVGVKTKVATTVIIFLIVKSFYGLFARLLYSHPFSFTHFSGYLCIWFFWCIIVCMTDYSILFINPDLYICEI